MCEHARGRRPLRERLQRWFSVRYNLLEMLAKRDDELQAARLEADTLRWELKALAQELRHLRWAGEQAYRPGPGVRQ